MKRNMQNTFQLTVGVWCCLQICNSVVNMVMGLVLGQSLMVISHLLLCQSISLYNVRGLLLFTCKLLIVYKHLNT